MNTDYRNEVERVYAILEEAMELAQRFPDLSDSDVLEHIELVFHPMKVSPESVLARGILIAYDREDTDAGMQFIQPEGWND